MRIQLALNVKNLEEAIEFYSKLFNVEVNKRKPGYANFSVEDAENFGSGGHFSEITSTPTSCCT